MTRLPRWQPILLIAVGTAIYSNSLDGVFLLDDNAHIVHNARIRDIGDMGQLLSGKRPLLDASLALNFALSELEPWSYHVFNIAIHILASLTLLGIVRRMVSLSNPRWSISVPDTPALPVQEENGELTANNSTNAHKWIAFVVALLWLVHPLHTQSVTYVVQRSESMMGLFFLLTLYCAIRASQSTIRASQSMTRVSQDPLDDPRTGATGSLLPVLSSQTESITLADELSVAPRRSVWPMLSWSIAAILSCALGMGCKAVMITAPIVVLLLDWACLSGSLKAAFTRHWGLYVGLVLTWSIPWLTGVSQGVLDPSNSGAHVGFGFRDISPLQYLLTQSEVIIHYVRLAFWPFPLCFDYDWPVVTSWTKVTLPGIVVLCTLGVTLITLRRKPMIGVVGAVFFLILAPTSSIIPIKDPAFEHRMYLPLAAVIALVVVGAHASLRRCADRLVLSTSSRHALAMVTVVLSAGTLCFGVLRRNGIYHDSVDMWQDVVAKRPDNSRAHDSLGAIYFSLGRTGESVAALRRAIQVDPENASAQFNLGAVLVSQEEFLEAERSLRRAIELKPDHAFAHASLGNTLSALQQPIEAIASFREALRLDPNLTSAWLNLANTLALQGNDVEAVNEFRALLKQSPDYATAHYNLAGALMRQGLARDAIDEYKEALRCDPQHPTAHQKLGSLYFLRRQMDEAVEVYTQGTIAHPDNHFLFRNLGASLASQGKFDQAIEAFQSAVTLAPDDPGVHYNLGTALARVGRFDEAATAFFASLSQRPNDISTLVNYGRTLMELKRFEEAADQFRAVLEISPGERGAERALRDALSERE